MKKSVTLLAVLALSISCSKVEKAEKNMDTMKDKTNKMAATTDKMKDTTTIMYTQVRSKEAEDTRSKKFEILSSDEKGFGERLAAAAVYFKSFEFQFWTANQEYDDKHTRDLLILDATNEFTKRICDLYEKINTKKMSPTKDGKKHAFEQSFYALAATMHMNHHFQDLLVDEKANVKSISFYDVLKSALNKESNGMNLNEGEKVLVSGINREIMIELVKARVDILAALALKNLTDKRDMTIGQKTKGLLHKLTGGRLGSIDLPETYSKMNEPTKQQTAKYLDAAVKAKTFLHKLNVDKDLEDTLKSAFSKLDLGEIEQPQGDNVVDAGESKADSDKRRVEIRNYIDLLLQ